MSPGKGATDVPTKKLTDLFVERAPAPARGRIEYFDAAFSGLALRVTDKGHKSWSLFYRFNGCCDGSPSAHIRRSSPPRRDARPSLHLSACAKALTQQKKREHAAARLGLRSRTSGLLPKTTWSGT